MTNIQTYCFNIYNIPPGRYRVSPIEHFCWALQLYDLLKKEK